MANDTTTEILFNSPALHSLKRNQLVKLCKIHALKANGKNTDIVDRLRQHAQTLPPDSPLRMAVQTEEARARELAKSIPADSDDDGSEHGFIGSSNSSWAAQPPRPSEQWEIVMDDIAEEPEYQYSTNGTMTSIRTTNGGAVGEFGTGTSKSSSVTSSIKAIASTLGLKRSTADASNIDSRLNATGRNRVASDRDSLMQTSVPYENIPPSSSLPVTELDQEPIPGEASRAGRPAPVNARLSVGDNATSTTIRLVTSSSSGLDANGKGPATPRRSNTIIRPALTTATPQLKAFATRYDLITETPGLAGARVWPPPSPNKETTYEVKRTPGNLYPDLPTSDDEEEGKEVNVPGGASITSPTPQRVAPPIDVAPARSTSRPSLPAMSVDSSIHKDKAPSPSTNPSGSAETFVFGSSKPTHSVSNTQFQSAAASVLEEMNKRLAAEGVAPIAADILDRKPMGLAALPASSAQIKPKDRFASTHDTHFNKMDSIANHYAARRGAADKQKAVAAGMKRKSAAIEDKKPALGKGVPSARKPNLAAGTRVISAGSRKKVLPGGLANNESDEVDNEGDKRSAKRQRVTSSEDDSSSANKEVRRVSLTGQVLSPEEIEREQKDREAIRRKLEVARARRRSGQVARQSIGMGRPTVAARQTLAQESMSKVGRPSVTKGTTTPVKPRPKFGLFSAAKSIVQSALNRSTSGSKPTSNAHATISKTTPKPNTVPKASTISVASRMHATTTPGESSHGAKPPIPPRMTAPHPYLARKDAANASTVPSRTGIMASNIRASAIGSTNSKLNIRNNAAPATSLGARPRAPVEAGGLRKPSTSRPSVLGVFDQDPPPAAAASSPAPSAVAATLGSPVRPRTASRLLAPTASSLAKQALGKNVLDPITNSPQKIQAALLSPRKPVGDREAKIFSKPLVLPSVPKTAPVSPTKQQPEPQSQQKEQEQPIGSEDKSIVDAETLSPNSVRPKLSGRRPRISRSKVIAKLALQRAESANQIDSDSNNNNNTPTKPRQPSGISAAASASRPSPRVRSSIGSNVRQSYSGKIGGDNSVLLSAKKRVRQSEYLHRRGQIAATSNRVTQEDQMNVDD